MKMSLDKRINLSAKIEQLYTETNVRGSFMATRIRKPKLDELFKLLKQAIRHDSSIVYSHKWSDAGWQYECKVCGAAGMAIQHFDLLGRQKMLSILKTNKTAYNKPIFMKSPYLTCNEMIMKDVLE